MAFVTSPVPQHAVLVRRSTHSRCLNRRSTTARPAPAKRCRMQNPGPSAPESAVNARGTADTSSSSAQNENVASWEQELQLLLDPSMPTGAKQVLLQDLAKRSPEILNDFFAKTSCKEIGLAGLADVFRQFQEDLLPDLVKNGPRYFTRAAEGLPKTLSRISSDAEAMRPGMPTRLDPKEVQREFRNIFNKTPEGLFTPDFKVLGKFEGYEVRQYPTLIVAETPMKPENVPGSGATEVESASAMGQSFSNLAGFLFGKNKDNKAMKMTTPVILSKGQPEETMSFIIGEYESVDAVPESLADGVTLREQVGQVFGVSEFTGFVTQGEANRQYAKLLSMLQKDGIALSPDGATSYKCMIYNGPSTLPNLRRNEMMIEVAYPVNEEDVVTEDAS